MFNILKPKQRRNDALGQFLRANCKKLWIHEDGFEDLFSGVTGTPPTCEPAGKVFFALYGTLDLSNPKNIDLCRRCLNAGIEIHCDTARILKSNELVNNERF